MTDWAKPTTASGYTNYTDEANARDVSLATQFNSATVTDTNLPDKTVRWNDTNKNWERWNLTVWGALATLYGISISGNAATATTAASCSGNSATATTASSCSGNAASSSSCSGNAATASEASALTTTNNYRGNSLGIGTPASGTSGEIRAANNITAYYSDARLKAVSGTIKDALNKVCSLSGVVYKNNAIAAEYGYTSQEEQVGVLAQEVASVMPQVVTPAPFDIGQNEDGTEFSLSGQDYMTVRYDRLVPLLIEAIKELEAKVRILEAK